MELQDEKRNALVISELKLSITWEVLSKVQWTLKKCVSFIEKIGPSNEKLWILSLKNLGQGHLLDFVSIFKLFLQMRYELLPEVVRTFILPNL